MSGSKVLTNNSFFEDKVKLRVDNLPDKNEITVFEAYGGEGLLWDEVIKRCPQKTITVLRCEITDTSRVVLKGDNIKFMKSLDLKRFDIVDLDAYGVPFVQMEEVFAQGYKGTVFVTYIQTMMGQLPHGILQIAGYTKTMIKRCPTLFGRRGFETLKTYLSVRGVTAIKYYRHDKKIYLAFNLV